MSRSQPPTQTPESRTFKDDLGDSATLFQLTVKDTLEEWFDSTIHSVEATTADKTTELLDQIAGVDAWEFNRDTGTRAIGSRVQWGNNAYPNNRESWAEVDEPQNTFTVRHKRDSGNKTEYEKRLQAIESDRHDVSPHWTVQAYCDDIERNDDGNIVNATLLSFAICETYDLITHIRDGTLGRDYYERKVHNSGVATFWVVPFKTLTNVHADTVDVRAKYNFDEWTHYKTKNETNYYTCDDCGNQYFGKPNRHTGAVRLTLCDDCIRRWANDD